MADHLFRRGKTWYGWVWVTGPTGEKRQEKFSTGCTDRKAAAIVVKERERDTAAPDAAARRDAKLEDAFALLIADRTSRVPADGIAKKKTDRSRDTVAFYEKQARNWYLYAGRRVESISDDVKDASFSKKRRDELRAVGKRLALADVDHRFIDAFILHRRANGTGDYTISKDRTVLRMSLALAERAGKWGGNLSLCFPRGFETGYEPTEKHLTWDQLQRLLAAYDDQPHRRAIIAYMVMTSAEWRAVGRAQKSDVTKASKLVHVRGTKRGLRDRFVPVVADWQRALLKLIVGNGDGKDGALFSRWTNARRSLAAAADQVGVPHFSPHVARYTYTHLMKAEGLTHEMIYPALGHADARMLDRIYGRTSGAELAKLQTARIEERRASLRVIDGGKARPKAG